MKCLPRARGFTAIPARVKVRVFVSSPYAGVHRGTSNRRMAMCSVFPYAGFTGSVLPRAGFPLCLPRTRGFTGLLPRLKRLMDVSSLYAGVHLG